MSRSKPIKKVLIITYYWPPSGAVGVHRCLKFAKYLIGFGWEPIIYTAKNAQYPYLDDSNFKHIPKDIEILRHRITEPFNLFKFLSGRRKNNVIINPVQVREKKQRFIDKLSIWIRGNFFIPDARSLWINPSVRYLSKFIKKNKIDAILSDGPPHTNTVIACKLAEKFKIPWLADYQDPWTQVDYYKDFKISKLADKKHKRMEQAAFKNASKITIASPTWKKDLESIGAKNVDVIFWGYDEDDFNDLTFENTDDFIISHAGLFGHDRNPVKLFEALNEIKSENKQFAKRLKIKLAGSVDFSVKEAISQNRLEDQTKYLGSIPRDDAIEMTKQSSVLLLPLNKADNAMGRIPGKLFEQVLSKVPILCLGPKGSDVERIIDETNSGKSFEYSEKEQIKAYITDVFNNFISHKKRDEQKNLEKYSVKNQVKKIAGFLDEITTS